MTPPVGKLPGTCRMKCPKSMTCHSIQKIKAIRSMSQRSALAPASCHANCQCDIGVTTINHQIPTNCAMLSTGRKSLVASCIGCLAKACKSWSPEMALLGVTANQVANCFWTRRFNSPLSTYNVITCHRIHPNFIFDLTFPYVPCSLKFPWPRTHSTNQLSSIVP